MKSKVMINAIGGTNWIGGLYYKQNVLFSLLLNDYLKRYCEFIIVTDIENAKLFNLNFPELKVICLSEEKSIIKKVKLLFLCIKNKCKYIFPDSSELFSIFGITSIQWIPDFQHNHFPQFFSKQTIDTRNKVYNRVAVSQMPLVLSSQDCKMDFQRFYKNDRSNIYVVPFVSYIEPTIRKINLEKENIIIQKYHLQNVKYACIMNQFWQHKNHIVIFKAMEIFYLKYPNSKLAFLFTGKMEDYRNPEYINKLNAILDKPEISKHVKMLGFIERDDQVVIMKNAEFVIQPSLFEGWGTVVEDAKVLDKTILLSDISIHREQKNDKCILFDPYNPNELAVLIEEESIKKHVDDIEAGILDMYIRAKKYSSGFEQLIKNTKNKK